MNLKLKKPPIFTSRWAYAEIPFIPKDKRRLDLSSVVAMGSCDARNIIRCIDFHTSFALPRQPWDILYNPFSITGEVARLFDKSLITDSCMLTEISSEGVRRYRDPWRTWHVFPQLKTLLTENEKFDIRAKELVLGASGFLFTLGLSEVWYPNGKPDFILNQVPFGSMRLNRKAWKFKFATVSEVYGTLERLVTVIRQNVGSKKPIIFTLSPVPLKYTASGLSIREANNISKATLLLALQSLSRDKPYVDYFPSYEIVQSLIEKDSGKVWQADGRHISAEVVDIISREFISAYGDTNMSVVAAEMSKFWVPLVNKNGEIIGRQYVDGKKEITR